MADAVKKYERIAVEEGFTIPEIAQLQGRDIGAGREPSSFRQATFRALLDLGPDRIKTMDEDGIAMQVCVLAGNIVQDIDPVQGNELAALSNDRLAEAAKKFPGRITGLAAFAPRDPARAAAELERSVKRLGLKGGIVNSHSLGEYLDDRKFWPIFGAAEALGVPVYLHPREPHPDVLRRWFSGYPELALASWGFAAETCTHYLRLMAAGLFDAHPKLTIILGHLGEGLPFWLARLDDHTRGAFAHRGLKRRSTDYLRDNTVITTSGNFYTPALLCSVMAMGVDNVIFSVDWPFESNKEARQWLDSLPLSVEDKEKIAHKNAERVLKL